MVVYDDYVNLNSEGVFGGASSNSIRFDVISAITVRFAGMGRGSIHFTIPGGSDGQSGSFLTLDGDIGFGSSRGSNTFNYSNGFLGGDGNDELATKIKLFIEAKIKEARAPKPSSFPSSNSIAGDLAKLAELKAQGALTDAEFQLAKSRLLG